MARTHRAEIGNSEVAITAKSATTYPSHRIGVFTDDFEVVKRAFESD